MTTLNISFRVINSEYKPLKIVLYRSPSPHPQRYKNIKKLEKLKSFTVDSSGEVNVSLSKKEVEKLRSRDRKVIYLVISIDHKKEQLYISNARLLAKWNKGKSFLIDIGKDNIASDHIDDDMGDELSVDDSIQNRQIYSLGEVTKATLEHRNEVSGHLQSGLKDDIISKRRKRKNRRKFIQGLMAKGMRSKPRNRGDRYVQPNIDASTALAGSIQTGLERLGKFHTSGMNLHFSKDFFEDAGIKHSKDWKKLTSKDWLVIQDKLQDSLKPKRIDRLISDCRNKHIAESTEGELVAADNEEEIVLDDNNTQEQSSTSVEDIFKKLCSDLSTRLDTADRPGTDDIAESVKKSVSAGPADTTAYYDFHTLNIAWEDVWTSVYDDNTEKEISKVYDEIVQIVGDEVADDIENTEYTELTEFLDDLSEATSDAERGPGRTAPVELSAWISDISKAWPYLTEEDQSYLSFLHQIYKLGNFMMLGMVSVKFPNWMMETIPSKDTLRSEGKTYSDWAKETAEKLIEKAEDDTYRENNLGLGRLGRLMDGIHNRLYKEPYEFDVFAPGTYNYGLIHTYQQKWKPLSYQVGDLISTMPLAPGEKKSYSVKKTINAKSERTSKASSSLMNSSSVTSMTRSQADIVAKATYSAATSATINTNFGMEFGMFKGGGNSSGTVSGNAASESQTTKQNIRENTLSAAQEYKDERSLEISSSQDTTSEYTMTSEISNPNNEITVTYLFYELQRRFEVSSRLDKLTPTVMVAFDVPQPSEIDEDWLLTYDWILRRSLLDPSLSVALDYIREGLSSDELSVEVYKVQWEVQVAAVQELKQNMEVNVRYRDLARNSLQSSAELVADKFGLDDLVNVARGAATLNIASAFGPIGTLAGIATGGKKVSEAVTSDLTKEEIAAAQESARLGMEWANADLQTTEAKYQNAIHALEKATSNYVDAIKRRQQMRTRIDQLRIHVKENILYYMQAIWAHEPSDQRYFRLYNQKVIWPEANGLPQMREVVIPPDPEAVARAEALKEHFDSIPFINVEVKMPEPKIVEEYPKRPLHEVADLDNLLGFKGNYAIFPLRENNAVTNYMSQEFLDSYFGVIDPDGSGNMPTESEALEIAKCMWKRAGNDEGKRREIVVWLTKILQNQIFVSDEIVVPSGELFIEALPGSHPLLEDFKLQHRAVDLEKSSQDLVHSRIQSIRHVKRLMENELSDPNIDKNIQINGTANLNVDTE